MNHSGKGQAAFEYLITYGWAFMVIIAAVGVLSYFGLLNPQRYVPDNCDFGEQLKCVDFLIVNEAEPGINGYVILRMRNNFGEDITITDAGNLEGQLALKDSLGVDIDKGEIKRVIIEIADTTSVPPKDKLRYKINVEFRRQTGTILHNLTGTLFAEVADTTVIGDQVS